MKIHGLQKLTLLDYPGKVACTVFIAGCNMRCPWCSNPDGMEMDAATGKIETTEALTAFILSARPMFFDGGGVTLTGGEATTQFEAVKELLSGLRAEGINTCIETNASHPRLPLTSYQDFSAFKLYMHDVGLLGAMSGTAPSMLIDGNALFTNFKGSLTEQFVLQELSANGITTNYWSSDSGNAEVEFVVQGEKDVFPIEAKAGINTKAKSLRVYREHFSPPYAIRTSLQPHHDGESVKDIPLYAFGSHIAHLIAAGRGNDSHHRAAPPPMP